MDPFEELDHEENLWDFNTRTTYLQEAVDTDLFRDIRKKILPAKAEEVAKVFSTVIPGDQVDTELCSKSREKIFEERKDTTLSGKVDQRPPVRGQFGEASSSFVEGYKAKNSALMKIMDTNMRYSEKSSERNLREFVGLRVVLTRSRGGPATGRCGGHTQVSRQAKHYAHKGINTLCHVTKRSESLPLCKEGNESMYRNTSGYVHMGLRLTG